MKNKRYFFKDLDGVNADIERHRVQEARIRGLIENAIDERTAAVYRGILGQLLASKADAVSKIGKKT